jgi:hypothetical protein
VPRPPDQLHSGCVQSPDDLEATYRNKNGKKSKGQTIHVTETAHPENELNLLTDIHVTPNNIDDSRALNKRIDHLKAKTPDLDEHHYDGAYGSADNDEKYEEHQINPIQTGIRGVRAEVDIEIDRSGEENYQVCCLYQEATIHEFTCRMPGGKLKVRGHFKSSIFAYAVGISSNFGRMFRYLTNPKTDRPLVQQFFKELTGPAWSLYRIF